MKVKNTTAFGSYAVVGTAAVKNVNDDVAASGCSVSLSVVCKHSFGAWVESGSGHKRTCSVCQNEKTASHGWDKGTVIKQATCKDGGQIKYTCTGCGATKTETIAKLSTHTYDNACDTDCNVCGEKRSITHSYKATWSSDKTQHWHECSVCKDKKDVAAHTPGAAVNKKEKEKLLRQFQCDYNRETEETFAQTLSEDDRGRLFFINEHRAFTDGKNIVVDPAKDGLFADTNALRKTEKFLAWPAAASADPWYALRIITRAQTIHECLHILYTDFPCGAITDPRCDTANKKKTMSLLSNIIEDAYIEAVGCSLYDSLEMFLQFDRISRLFASAPSLGTVDRVFAEAEAHDPDAAPCLLPACLNYMVEFLLYPMIQQEDPEAEIRQYVEDTKHLF